jgi:hypothetical protein
MARQQRLFLSRRDFAVNSAEKVLLEMFHVLHRADEWDSELQRELEQRAEEARKRELERERQAGRHASCGSLSKDGARFLL